VEADACSDSQVSFVQAVVSETLPVLKADMNGKSFILVDKSLHNNCAMAVNSSFVAGKMTSPVARAASAEHYVLCDKAQDGDSDVIFRQLVDSKSATDAFSTSLRVLPKRAAAKRIESFVDSSSDEDDSNDERKVVNRKFAQRKTSITADDDTVTSSRRSACTELNRNALNAKLNREKKKAYIASLEARQTKLCRENSKLSTMIADLTFERNKFANEVQYLRSVLANDSALAHLISGINGRNVYLSEQFETSRKRKLSVDDDHDYIPFASSAKSSNSSSASAGVCLHVHQSHMSLEFCEQCARMSSKVRCVDSSS
jgi:hypothetical protein